LTSPTLARKLPDRAGGRALGLPAWLRNPAGAAIIAAVLFGILGLFTLAVEIGRPFSGYVTYGFLGSRNTILSLETPKWFPGWQEAGLKHGDELLTINGRPYAQHAWSEIEQAYEAGGSLELSVYRPSTGQTFTAELAPRLFTFSNFLDLKFPEFLVWLVFCMLAVIVLRAQPDAQVNQVFATVAALIGLHRLTAVTSMAMDERLLQNLPKMVHLVVAGLIPPLAFHMAFLFPTPLKRDPSRLLRVLYALGLLSGVVLALTRMPFWARVPDKLDVALDTGFYQIMMAMVLFGVLSLFGRLLWVWYRNRSANGPGNRRTRRVVRIVLTGLVMALPPVIVIMLPGIPGVGQRLSPFWEGLDLRYLLLAIPISFALAIIRYHTFQNPSPLFIFVLVFSTSALLAAVAVALWSAHKAAENMTPGSPHFQVLFFAILLASHFWSRQTAWRGWFGRMLHRDDRNYESARAFGHRVMSRMTLRALPESMTQALVDELALERAAVWSWDADTGAFELAGSAGNNMPPVPQRLVPPAGAPSIDRVMHVTWASMPPWLGQPAADGRIEVINRLSVEDRTIGLLGIGRRWDEDIFDERDLAVVELVGQQAALFMQASMQIEELRRVPERVAAAQEEERYRLAGELHDTIQQFLGRLPFFLTVSREKMATDQAEAAAILDRCIGDVEEASVMLREIRANLAPNQLEISLIKPLHNLAEYVEKRTGMKVCLGLSDSLDEATTAGTRHALYRVIQQATDNAVAHAGASEVAITLRRVGGRVLFSVIDDGHGVEPQALTQASARGSFGLQSMRARVETVGGEFAFDSVEGRGTTVSGWVPAAPSGE